MFVKRYSAITFSLMAVTALSACAVNDLLPDRRPDYKASKVENRLEVPPDLTASTIDDTLVVPEINPTGTATLSAYSNERSPSSGQAVLSDAVLRQPPGMRIERAGDKRWLVVNIAPDQAWPQIKEFWTSNGFLLQKEDPRIGIMETDWLENRSDIPDGPIRDLLKRVVDFAYSAPTRDKFRVRLERADNGTEVFLTHYGVQETVTSELGTGTGRRDTSSNAIWQPRPSDPELEAEMLNRLMVYLGASEQRAQTQIAQPEPSRQATPRARLAQGPQGQKGLVVEEEYGRAWRLVGLALDDTSFVVEDQNRAEGLYMVGYNDPLNDGSQKGVLSRLAFWKDSPPPQGVRYQIRLAGRGPETLVVVLDEQGQPDSSPTAEVILESIAEVIGTGT